MILRGLATGLSHRFETSAHRCSNAIAAADMESMSPTSKRRPLWPSSISSGTPPTRVPIVGTLHAMASSAARPNDSISLGISIRSASGSSSLTLSCLPIKWMRSCNVVLARKVLGDAAVGAVADEHQPRRHGFRDPGKDLDDVLNALHRTEVGEVDEKTLVRLRRSADACGDQLWVADVDVAVDEVADDFDLGGDAEGLAGAVAQDSWRCW